MADLQSDIKIGTGGLTGTVNYLDDYTGYSGDPDLQKGNFIALHFEAEDADVIKCQVINGTYGLKPLDEDGICIFRIVDKDAQAIQAIAYKDGTAVATRILDIRGLTLEAADD